MHFSRKTLLTIASAAIVVIGGFYYFFFLAKDSSTVLAPDAPASAAETSFIGLVGQLGSVEFDTHVLDDARFNALVDIRTPIVPETSGRKDPFGPLGK
jgi:hypothetical protein